jgi:hypothetical protein
VTADHASELPDVAAVLAPILERVRRDQQPLLIAIAERRAAERYRGWAAEVAEETQRDQLLACARREREIAERIESLYPDAAALQRRILSENPEVDGIDRRLFSARPLEDQWTLQARGERLGAATWRAFAAKADGASREAFLACALLEEESAVVLEALLKLPRV